MSAVPTPESHRSVASVTESLMWITARPELIFVEGRGSWLTDHNGKRYLDYVQGWAVNCLGHCPPQVQKALAEQSARLINPSPAFFNEPAARLATLLTKHSCFDRVFFANTGAEANEGAIKLARKWGRKHRDGANVMISYAP
jgi:acetylornithine/N-succinyldiaminopimelate aminotransferase